MENTTTEGPWKALEEFRVYRDVMFGKSVIDTPKPFAKNADKSVKAISSLCLPAEAFLIEPDNIEASARIKDTFQILMIKRFFDEQNLSYLQFFKMANNEKAFFTKFYGKGARVHQKIAADHCGSCLGDYEPRCKVWLHSNCFFDCTAQKINFSIKDFFSKCDQIRSFLRIWSHLLKKSLMEKFTFSAVLIMDHEIKY